MTNPVLTRGLSTEAGWAMPASDAGITIAQADSASWQGESAERMTVNGVINKMMLLMFLLIGSAAVFWRGLDVTVTKITTTAGTETTVSMNTTWSTVATILSIGGAILAMVAMVKPNIARTATPIYAICQGAFLGIISAQLEAYFEGIVIQAVLATMLVALAMFILWRVGIIKVTRRFQMIVMGALLGIVLFYFANFIYMLFGGGGFDIIWNTGPMGILFTGAIAVVAALTLALDFQFIDEAVAAGLPKQTEWIACLGLLVSIVWLYIQVLQLIAKLRS